MNWEAISAIGQLVGALAVVISLIYWAREVRSNAHATRLATRRSMFDPFSRVTQQIAVHADLAELRNRGVLDFESLDAIDRTRFSSYMHGIFRTAEDAYYLHLERHLDTRVWLGVEASMRELNARPGVQAWWRSRSH